MRVEEVLDQIRKTANKDTKKKILRDNSSDLVKRIIVAAAPESDVKYGVKKLEITSTGTKTFEDNTDEIFALLDDLNKRRITGNIAKERTNALVNELDPLSQWVFSGIIGRNLKVGMSSDSFNEVFPDLIFVYKVSRGHHINDKMRGIIAKNPSEWLNSRKMDGIRTNIWFEIKDGIVQSTWTMSREGTQIMTFTKLEDVAVSAINAGNFASGNYVLDGETCIIDSEGNENFRMILSEWNKKNHTIEHPYLKILDFLTEEEWAMKKESPVFIERLNRIKDLPWDSNFMNIHEQIPVASIEQVDAFQAQAVANGWEGSMLRRNAPYIAGESWDLLKYKGVYDDEFRVTRLETGIATFQIVGKGNQDFDCVSAIIVDYDGFEVRVGSGLTLEERIRWKEHPEEVVGHLATIKFNEKFLLEDGSKSLRFPRLKAVLGVIREA